MPPVAKRVVLAAFTEDLVEGVGQHVVIHLGDRYVAGEPALDVCDGAVSARREVQTPGGGDGQSQPSPGGLEASTVVIERCGRHVADAPGSLDASERCSIMRAAMS